MSSVAEPTAKHTPGPWTLETNGACWNLRSPDRVDHFLILVGMTHNNPGEHETNARLIAAAPELLDACIQARGALRLDHMVDDEGKPFGTTQVALECLGAAIVKAEGGAK